MRSIAKTSESLGSLKLFNITDQSGLGTRMRKSARDSEKKDFYIYICDYPEGVVTARTLPGSARAKCRRGFKLATDRS